MSGAETSRHGDTEDDDALDAHWTCARYCIDFVKEDGVWKIWHMHVVGLFHTPYYQSWVDYPKHGDSPNLPEGYGPDEEETGNFEYYTTKAIPIYPPVPRPYKTFSEVKPNYDPSDRGVWDQYDKE